MYQTLIASQTLGVGGATSITFSSIPSTYTDLVLVVSTRTGASSSGNDPIVVQFNGDTTGANYSYVMQRGYGGSAFSDSVSGTGYVYLGSMGDSTNSSNAFGQSQMIVPSYALTQLKNATASTVSLTNVAATVFYEYESGSKWTGTAAISSIKIYAASGSTMVQNTTAYLYGLTKGSGGATTTP